MVHLAYRWERNGVESNPICEKLGHYSHMTGRCMDVAGRSLGRRKGKERLPPVPPDKRIAGQAVIVEIAYDSWCNILDL